MMNTSNEQLKALEAQGQYATGFCSYITAFVTVAALGWGVARIILKRRPAGRSLSDNS